MPNYSTDYFLVKNRTLANQTTENDDVNRWTFLPVFETSITPLAILLNAFVLVRLIQTQRSQPAFNIYLINLSTSNLAFSIFTQPLEIVNAVNSIWPLGHNACMWYWLNSLLLRGCIINSHALLTINRLWAVLFPIHYHRVQRNHARVAVSICVTMWVYVSILVGSVLVVFGVYEEGTACFLDIIVSSSSIWNHVAQFLAYGVPMVVLILGLPVVWYKRRSQLLNRVQTRKSLTRESTVASANRPVAERSHFRIWLVMTCATVVCWIPLLIFYVVAALGGDSDWRLGLMVAGTFFYCLTPLIDPILLIMAMPVLRTSSLMGWLSEDH